MRRMASSNARAPALYLDAARQMRPRQLAFRLRRAVPPRVLAVGLSEQPGASIAPLATGLFASTPVPWGPVAPPAETGRFCAAGATRDWGTPRFWEDPGDGLLFLFALHGFDELVRYGAGSRSPAADRFWREVLEDWCRRHRRPQLPGWHPYPLSGRILAWLSVAGSKLLPPGAGASLAMQAAFLGRAVEHDIGGNHVLRNAVALTAAGLCLGDPRLTRRGTDLLGSELAAQILADGGHEERSPSYHAAILTELDDLAVLMNRAHVPVPSALEDIRGRMASWLRALAAPDGSVPRLNDAWDLTPAPGASPERVRDLAATGYVVLRSEREHIVIDVAPLCPSHLPAHAHADALSFVAWFDGRAAIVDPGIGGYQGPLRNQLRSTSVHATVAVDDQDQCIFWGPFRAACLPAIRRGVPEERDGVWFLRASHDGYRRLADPVRHHRLFVWLPGEGLAIADWLEARTAHAICSSLPLAPSARLRTAANSPVIEVETVAVRAIGAGPRPRIVEGLVSPYLGVTAEAPRIVRELDAQPGAAFGWSLLRPPASAELDGRWLLIRRGDGHVVRIGLDDPARL